MNNIVFIVVVALQLTLPISIVGVTALYSHAQKIKTPTPLDASKQDLGGGLYRFENTEAVCYAYGSSLQCYAK